MRNLTKIFTILILVFLSISNCKKMESPTLVPEGQLVKVTLTDITGISDSYGKLIAVTTHAEYKDWAQLWFEDSLQTIRMVRIQFISNQIHNQVLEIPRTNRAKGENNE